MNTISLRFITVLLLLSTVGCKKNSHGGNAGSQNHTLKVEKLSEAEENQKKYDQAAAAVQMIDTYHLIMFGKPAEPSTFAVKIQFGRVQKLMAEARDWNQKVRAGKTDEYCTRFLDLYDNTTRDMERSYQGYMDSTDQTTRLDYSVRLTIFQGVIGTFTRALVSDKEAGPALVFATELGKRCEFAQREAWVAHALKVRQEVDLLQTMAFGRKGIKESEQEIAQMRSNKAYRENMDTAITAGLFIAQIPLSILLWEFTLARGLVWIITSAAFLTKIKYISWVAYSVAESLAYYYLDEHVFKDDEAALHFGSKDEDWYQGLEEIKRLVDSDVNSPEIYLDYLYQTQNIVYQRYIYFLSTFEKEILSVESRHGSTANARAFYVGEMKKYEAGLRPAVE